MIASVARGVAPVGEEISDRLGEGPHWDRARGQLVRVDLYDGLVHRLDLDTLRQTTLALGGAVGFAVPRVTGGFVVGAHHRIELVDARGEQTVLATLPGELPTSRINDGKCDAAGRLWTGTLSRIRQRGACALFRVEPDGAVTRMLDGITMSNGLGWSPDGDRLYYVDSTTRQVDEIEFDPAAGTLGRRRCLAAINPHDGMPDGLTVDAEGGVWVALYGGGVIHRYAPDGTLGAVLRLPVQTCTSLAFGGDELDVLFITTGRHRLSDRQLADQPLAGRLFRADVGVAGLPPAEFAA